MVQSIVTARSGMPFSVSISGDALGTKAGTPMDYPQYNPGASGCTAGAVNPGNPNQYLNLSCFSLPMATPAISASCVAFTKAPYPGTCANLLGNTTRNAFVGPGMVNADFSLLKNHQVTERLNAQFRAEVFNMFNKPNFNYPSPSPLALYGATGAPIGGAGKITTTSTPARQIQFAVKLVW